MFDFQERWIWTVLFSSATTQFFQSMRSLVFKLLSICMTRVRLGLFLAYCAKGSNRPNFPWIRLPRWPRWRLASCLRGASRRRTSLGDRGRLSSSTPVLARALLSFTYVSLFMLGCMVCQIPGIPSGEVVSSVAVAVVLGAAELSWLGHQDEHSRLGFNFQQRPFLLAVCCSVSG